MKPLNPFLQFGLTVVGGWAVDRWQKKREAAAAAAQAKMLPEPLRFAPEQLNGFTRVVPGTSHRAFDIDVGAVILRLLQHRSLVPVDDPSLARFGSAFRVVPLATGLPRAADVIRRAQAQGAVVCGSHSLYLLPNSSPVLMLIVLGGQTARVLCARGDAQQPPGVFALLSPPPQPQPQPAAAQASPTPPPPPQPAPSPVPDPVPDPVPEPPAESASAQTFQQLADELTQAPKVKPAKKANGKRDPKEELPPVASDGGDASTPAGE